VKDSQGRTTHYLAIKEDITERKRSEEELRSSREQLRALGFALARAEHQERRRIASLLHDDVIQSLALVQIKLGALRAQLGSCEQQNLLDTLRTHLDQAIGSTRRMTFQISPPILHELGLEAALSWLAEQMKEQHRLGCECVTESVRTILEEETSSLLFAATRELLLNVVKHARASKAHIATHSDSSLFRITVEDNGMGFNPATLSPASGKTRGFGLLNIRERLGYLGGECVIHSLPGHGTRVVLTIPIKRE
jgi:signal transduction histidine kinase